MRKKIDDAARNAMAMDGKGPWDSPGSEGPSSPKPRPTRKPVAEDSEPAPDADEKPSGPRNPWDPVEDDKPRGNKPRGPGLEDLLRRSRGGGGSGGGFGGLPKRADGKSWWPVIIGAFVSIWILWTSVHRIDSGEEGVITQFGKYSRTSGAGFAFTLPAPFETLTKVDTKRVRTTSIGSANAKSENLVLTKDQNLMDIAFDIRWSIKSPELFLFQLQDPDGTVEEIGESAMRAELANYDYNEAVGPQRGAIESQVRQRMQSILDEYRSGISISSISIRQSDPPEQVKDAFREVNSAQQQRETDINNARAYSSSVVENARGQTAEFDKIYEQYKRAPEVTKRRIYYETMEQVLGKVDKTVVESGNVTPYLPLQEVKRRAATPPQPEEVVVTGKTK